MNAEAIYTFMPRLLAINPGGVLIAVVHVAVAMLDQAGRAAR